MVLCRFWELHLIVANEVICGVSQQSSASNVDHLKGSALAEAPATLRCTAQGQRRKHTLAYTCTHTLRVATVYLLNSGVFHLQAVGLSA